MASFVEGPVTAPIVLREQTHEHLLDLRAAVSPSGDATVFSLAYTNQKPFKCKVAFEEMGPILNELRYASNMMARRQRLKLDRGAGKMMDLVEHALRPRHIEVLIDPTTGDRIYILMFGDEHAPMALRLSVADVEMLHQSEAEAVARAAH